MPLHNPLGAQTPLRASEPSPSPRAVPPKPAGEKPAAWRWGAAAVLLLLVAGLAFWQRQAMAPQRRLAAGGPGFRTVRAWLGSLERNVRITGVTAADRSNTLLAPQMRGTRGHGPHDFNLVLQRLAEAGTDVRQGEVVAEFDRQFMQVRLDDYESMALQHDRWLVRRKADLMVRRAEHDQALIRAKGQMEKSAQDLKKIPILSAIQSERYRLDYEEAKMAYEQLLAQTGDFLISEGSTVKAAELDRRVSRMEYDRAKRNVDRMVVRAPISGLVVMLTTHRGHENVQISKGDQVFPGQPYMRIVDRSSMVVDASINQVDAHLLRVGMRARVRFDAYPGVELPARVFSVGSYALAAGWRPAYVRNVPVRLRLEQMDARVIPDLTVSADLILESAGGATVVPREALFEGPGDSWFAYVRNGSGWEKRPLEVAMATHTAAAVRSGVRPGDILAAEVPDGLAEPPAAGR